MDSVASILAAILVSGAAASLPASTQANAPKITHPVTRDFAKLYAAAATLAQTPIYRRPMTEECAAFYDSLFEDQTLEVAVAFGYMDRLADEGPLVHEDLDYGLNYALDGHARAAFVDWIQESCDDDGRQLCDFQQSPTDEDLFARRIELRSGELRRVELRVTHGSANPFLDRNVLGGDRHREQLRQTFLSEENFFGAIGRVDAAFYIGHARGGGGPDFAPPILRSDLHVDFNGYYRKELPGVKKLLAGLRRGKRPARVISLMGCKTTELFVGRHRLEALAPDTMFVTAPELMGYKATVLATVLVIDSLLAGHCTSEMRIPLSKVETYYKQGLPPSPLSDLLAFEGRTPLN